MSKIEKDRQTEVRHWLLDRIDSEEIKASEKLPGAREIAEKVGVSLLTVQNAIETLVNEGVLETYPRKGSFVSPQWRECILQHNFRPNNSNLPWLKDIKKMVTRQLPKLYFCSNFHHSMLELRPTLALQSCRDQYIDMTELFNRCFPDKSDFFMEAFESYYNSDGTLPGIPFIFSPRVMFYNRELLEKAGCPEPERNWKWNDFIFSVQKLKEILPVKDIFNWNADKHQWLNFIFRTGGCLFDPSDEEDPVKIDHPDTRRGLKLFNELRNLAKHDTDLRNESYRIKFGQGKKAFMLSPRQDLYFVKRGDFKNWGTTSMPMLDDGNDLTTQASDLICVRKSCANLKMAEDFLKIMLSSEVQDFIGSQGYGIPIRKSSAYKSISRENRADWLFIEEIPHMSAQYNIDSVEIMNLVMDGINQIWDNGNDIDEFTSELAAAVRTFMKIRKNSSNAA